MKLIYLSLLLLLSACTHSASVQSKLEALSADATKARETCSQFEATLAPAMQKLRDSSFVDKASLNQVLTLLEKAPARDGASAEIYEIFFKEFPEDPPANNWLAQVEAATLPYCALPQKIEIFKNVSTTDTATKERIFVLVISAIRGQLALPSDFLGILFSLQAMQDLVNAKAVELNENQRRELGEFVQEAQSFWTKRVHGLLESDHSVSWYSYYGRRRQELDLTEKLRTRFKAWLDRSPVR